jgi:hypothetical protein
MVLPRPEDRSRPVTGEQADQPAAVNSASDLSENIPVKKDGAVAGLQDAFVQACRPSEEFVKNDEFGDFRLNSRSFF